jgi:predicted phage baseplate assembly protein
MPLDNAMPAIDDRRFDDLLEEIKARIARYTPEWQPVWNDYNDSDPGITLAQLVAWLSEMMIYRMNQVPEMNYLKFLELLGVELQAAQPARIDVTFPVKQDTAVPFIDVPIRTQVSAPADDGGPPLVYETEKSLRALTAQLLSVQAFDGAAHIDATADNDAMNPYEPFGPLAPVDAALVLGFGFPAAYPTPDQLPQIVFDLMVYSQASSAAVAMVTCGLPPSGVFAPARVQWEGWNGSLWVKMDALKDETAAFTRSGAITIRTPALGILKRDFMGAYEDDGTHLPLFWIRARLTKAQYETPPSLTTVRTNTAAALQAQTVKGEVLGGTNGTRNQKWTLSSTPVIAGSVHVTIDDGTGAMSWAIEDDLLDSGPQDFDLALAPGSGTLTAGDGVHGAVPIANPNNPDANVIAVEYRYGGGARGNVPANAINAMLSAVTGIDTGKVTNPFPAAGGRDEERLDDAKERARRMIRSQCRAVTAEDFEALSKQAGDIARAKALPLYHPQFPTIQFPGAVSIIIVPNAKRDPNQPFQPVPSDGLMRTVCAYLDQRRLLTTEVYVIAPSYQQISIAAEIVAKDDADTAAVRQDVELALSTYFDAIEGGDDGDGWGFGETVSYSKVYQRIFSVDGVNSISSLVITVDGEDQPECKDVPINPNGLLVSTANQVNVVFADEVAA